MTDLIFYTNPQSRGRIAAGCWRKPARIMRRWCSAMRDSMKAPDYLAINPMGKVPAIKHGDTVVTEGAAICAYLADAFPEAGLAPPAGAALRGTYYRWLFFAAGPVEAAITNRSLKVEPTAEQQRFVGYGSFDATIDTLETALTPGPYICGDQFTAADVYVGSQIGFGMMFGSIEKRPIFEDYFGRLQARPAAARAAQLDDALIAEQQQAQQPQPA